MTDLYIKTSTQADYDALMRLVEAAGYTWRDGILPTVNDYWRVNKENTAIRLCNHGLLYGSCDRYKKDGHTIEVIPNLAHIKEIWEVSRENRDAFTMKHRLPPHYKSARKLYIIRNKYSGTYTTKENEIYEALAVEYKPRESEVMPEKVKLPKFMCNWLDGFSEKYPLNVKERIGGAESVLPEVYKWAWSTNRGVDNQWKLIDALRYGYEPEPEQLYYVIMPIDRTHCFLNQNEDDGEVFFDEKDAVMRIKVKFTMPEILAIDPRYKAFAVPVEEVDGNE